MKNSRRSFMRHLVGAGSMLVAGAAKSANGVPSWVPPPKTFAEFTLNTPASVGANVSFLVNWCGGTFIRDYGPYGGAAYHGGGEHYSWPDAGGVLMLNCATRRYEIRCLPAIRTHMGVAGGKGSATNEWGAYADDDYPQMKHTYNCLSEMPAAWGGGERGSLVRVAHTGGLLLVADGKRTHGYSSTYRFDLSQATDGHSRLTGERRYDFGSGKPATVNDAIGCGMDSLREGWWAFARTGSGHGDRMCFTHRTGRVDNAATPPIQLLWGTVHHFADDDTLVAIAGGAPGQIVISHPGAAWSRVSVEGDAADLDSFHKTYLGYVGFKWSTLLQCFVGLDLHSQPGGPASVRLWKIVPPEIASQRLMTPWRVRSETLTSADGSQMNLRTDAGSVNGAFGRLVECPALRSFVWTRGVQNKGQLLRPAGT